MKVFSYEGSLHKEIFEELIGELESLLGAVNFPPGGTGGVSLVVHLAWQGSTIKLEKCIY